MISKLQSFLVSPVVVPTGRSQELHKIVPRGRIEISKYPMPRIVASL